MLRRLKPISILFSLFCLVYNAGIFAAETDNNVAKQLVSTNSAIKETKKRQKDIAEERTKLERELKELQKEMVLLAQKAGDGENELSDYEDKLAILEEQKNTKQNSLNSRQAEISNLISVMIGMKKLPPEAIIAMPGKLDQTMATARALVIITDLIKEESVSLKSQLAELDDIENKIRKSRENITVRKSDLGDKKQKLAIKIKERAKLYEELNIKDKKEEEQLAILTAKSKNLQDLIDALNQKDKKEQEDKTDIKKNAIAKNDENDNPTEFSPFRDGKKLHVPASGKIIRRYGDGKEAEFSRGITIKTREKASVVAPFAGEVVYAGSFRDYGKMVIIRHGNDFHTLLSGMEMINCTPGQLLVKGEPIGNMGKSTDTTSLYLELRKNSKPIDPKPYMKL